jgi:hypothetical protein
LPPQSNTALSKNGLVRKIIRQEDQMSHPQPGRAEAQTPTRVSLILPCYNEEEGVAAVLRQTPDVVDEVVVVDNNCTDDTARVARHHGARVVRQPVQGYGASYKKGFQAARGDVLVTLDADGTYPIERIPEYVQTLEEDDLDFMTVQRIPEASRGLVEWVRYSGNVVLNVATWSLFGVWLADSQSGMWVFRKSIFERFALCSDGMALSEEIKIRAFAHPELRCREVSGAYHNTRVGDSKLNVFGDGFGNLLFLFKLRSSRNGSLGCHSGEERHG